MQMENQSSSKSITDNDRKLIRDALIKQCDAKDGVADGLISDPLGCDFDPEMLACKGEKNNSCLAPEKAAAIKKAMGGPKTASGTQVYAGFLYDTGITNGPPFRGVLSPGPGIFGPATTDMTMDVAKEALAASPAARGFYVHEFDHLLRARGETDLLPRRQRPVVFAARYVRLLQEHGGCKWRSRRRVEVGPVLFRSRDEPLWRRPSAGSV